MNATQCTYESKGKFKKKYEFYLLDDFKSENELILRLTWSNQLSILMTDYFEVDYFYLKVLEDDEDSNFHNNDSLNDFWYIPDYCVEKHSSDEGKQLSKKIYLPSKYEFTMQTVVSEQDASIYKTRKSKTSTLIADLDNRLINLGRFKLDNKINHYDNFIIDFKNRIEYERRLSSCIKHFNGQYVNLDQFKDLIEIITKLKQLSATDYTGQQSCRELDCDTFSFYSYNDDLDYILKEFDQESSEQNSSEQEPSLSILYTFYLHYEDTSKLHHLIQLKKQMFSKEAVS